MSEPNPLYNPNHPPLLKTVPLGVIRDNPIIAGPAKVEMAILAINPWTWLNNFGGRGVPMLAGSMIITNIYTGIVSPAGATISNPGDQPMCVDVANRPTPLLAQVTQTPEWHLVRPPEQVSRTGKTTITEELSTETSVLETFNHELELSAEATASVSGFGASFSVTLGLRDTVSKGYQTQKTMTSSKTYTHEFDEIAGTTYTDWILYTKIEIEYIMKNIQFPAALSDEQLATINPGRRTYYVIAQLTGDRALDSELAA